MPDRYIEIDEEGLQQLYDGLNILESVDRDKLNELELCLYGLTQSEPIVDAAREAIAYSADLDETDVQLGEVAVAIRIGADTIRALLGSGFRAKQEDFAYAGAGGEGIRTQTFINSDFKPVLSVSEFSQMAIASSDAWLDRFLKQYGNKQPVEIKLSAGKKRHVLLTVSA